MRRRCSRLCSLMIESRVTYGRCLRSENWFSEVSLHASLHASYLVYIGYVWWWPSCGGIFKGWLYIYFNLNASFQMLIKNVWWIRKARGTSVPRTCHDIKIHVLYGRVSLTMPMWPSCQTTTLSMLRTSAGTLWISPHGMHRPVLLKIIEETFKSHRVTSTIVVWHGLFHIIINN